MCPRLKQITLAMSILACTVLPSLAVAKNQYKRSDSNLVEQGRYLVRIAGCNDCHTSGYAQNGGKVPEDQWLTGDQLGWRGPWGTTYPINLRLHMQNISEAQWVKTAHTARSRPPMPWFNLHAMSTRDLRAIYHFVKALGPAGQAAPAHLPPDQEPEGAIVLFPQPPE